MHKAKWTALFLCVLLMLGAYNIALAENQDQPSLTDIRCYFEHTILPGVFYSDPLSVLGGIDSTSLYQSWTRLAQDFGYANSYTESDFNVYSCAVVVPLCTLLMLVDLYSIPCASGVNFYCTGSACFRAITNQLYERNLITQDEHRKIIKELAKRETVLIGGKPCKAIHPRKLTIM